MKLVIATLAALALLAGYRVPSYAAAGHFGVYEGGQHQSSAP